MSKYFSVLASSYYINELYQNSKIILLQDDTKVNFEEIKKGETSEQHDDNANKILYCIICGNFVIKNNNNSNSIKVVANRGQLYGEEFLNLKSKILNTKNDIYTEGECRIFKIELKSILKIMNIKVKPSKILSFLQHINYMQKTEMFRNTSINKVIQICTLMKKEKFSKDQYIFRKGSIADKFYIIKKGAVIVKAQL